MVTEPITGIVRQYLRQLALTGLSSAYAVIYGSQVKGNPGQWSDIDLVVVSSRFDEAYPREEVQRLWRVAAKVDSRIEPIAAGVREFEENDSRAILEIARREGEKIYVDDNLPYEIRNTE